VSVTAFPDSQPLGIELFLAVANLHHALCALHMACLLTQHRPGSLISIMTVAGYKQQILITAV
jgi:phosphatidylserine decarboxylase